MYGFEKVWDLLKYCLFGVGIQGLYNCSCRRKREGGFYEKVTRSCKPSNHLKPVSLSLSLSLPHSTLPTFSNSLTSTLYIFVDYIDVLFVDTQVMYGVTET